MKPPVHPVKEFRLAGRWLTIPDHDPVPIPFGCLFSPDEHNLLAHATGDRMEGLFVPSGDALTQIYPSYAKTDAVSIDGSRVKVDCWQVVTDRDRAEALRLLAREHYLTAPRRGMILACRFQDPKAELRIRALSDERRTDTNSIAWLLPPGGIVGCAVLDHLFHGNPRGRQEAAQQLLKRSIPANWSRRRVVEDLGFAWVSRVAVDAPYRGLGLGALLAKHALRLAATHFLPRPRILEVITTVTSKSNATPSAPPRSRDFLCRAGFERAPDLFPSRPSVAIDDATGYLTVRTRAKKAYYFARVS